MDELSPSIRPWYNKKRYLIPLVLIIGGSMGAAGSGTQSPQVVPSQPAAVGSVFAPNPLNEKADSPEVSVEEAIEPEEAPAVGGQSEELEPESKVEAVRPSNQSAQVEPAFEPKVIPAQTCCKYCSKGKACGNSCISRSYTCHQPPGCACDS